MNKTSLHLASHICRVNAIAKQLEDLHALQLSAERPSSTVSQVSFSFAFEMIDKYVIILKGEYTRHVDVFMLIMTA